MVLDIGSSVEGKFCSIKGKQGTIISSTGDGKTEKRWVVTWKEATVKSKNQSSKEEIIIPLSRINDDEYSDSIISFKEVADDTAYSSYELKELDIVQLLPKRKAGVNYSIKNNNNGDDSDSDSDSDSENENDAINNGDNGRLLFMRPSALKNVNNTTTNTGSTISTKSNDKNKPKTKKHKPSDDDEDSVVFGKHSNITHEREIPRASTLLNSNIYGNIHYQMPLSRTEYYSHCKGTNKRAKRRCCRKGCTEKTAFYCVVCSVPEQELFYCYCSNDICFSEHVVEKYLAQKNATKS